MARARQSTQAWIIENQMIGTAEAAELIGISADTFRRWEKTGKLPLKSFRVGRIVRYAKKDIERWLALVAKVHAQLHKEEVVLAPKEPEPRTTTKAIAALCDLDDEELKDIYRYVDDETAVWILETRGEERDGSIDKAALARELKNQALNSKQPEQEPEADADDDYDLERAMDEIRNQQGAG